MSKWLRNIPVLAVAMAGAGLIGAAPADAQVEGDTIILGSAISITGKYSTNGIHASNGYNLAVKRINESGGVMVGGKSYKLKIKYYDDESTPARGAQLAERLIKQDGIKFMLGPYSSGLTKAIAPVTAKYKIPMVEAEGASRSLFTQGNKYIFAVLSTSEQYLASVITLAAEMAKKNGKKHRNGAFEIITALNSFHGRTMMNVAATGQPHYQELFTPIPTGFTHVPYDDIDAAVFEV